MNEDFNNNSRKNFELFNFDNNSHKNLELFRYYLNRDLARIDQNIQSNKNELLGYLIASLVDMLVVVLFSDLLSGRNVVCKLSAILVLIVLFVAVSKVANYVRNMAEVRRRESGREEYLHDPSRQAKIDDFDNIACDALLICEDYMQRYQATEKAYIRDFYLFEIIHHLTKSVDVFNEINNHPDLYISSTEKELIDSYRVDNYVEFAKAINVFLTKETENREPIPELRNDLRNLNEAIEAWPCNSTSNEKHVS